jgi:hypothetical protein
MPPTTDSDAPVALAAVAACGAVVIPLLALSPGAAWLALAAWLGGVALSYLAVVRAIEGPATR